uniref:Thiosulfate sulfurtransferase/rhodanese-like domain-containing protein 3 n=1 Tax=Phallusia mammillata TaxID=59560 RepID=A0A6F9DVX3_9ASCI|nr:thiosulfate sulfurtransferase/rhodanese-like domain-containing protein 3 [Phallusia mammillata]
MLASKRNIIARFGSAGAFVRVPSALNIKQPLVHHKPVITKCLSTSTAANKWFTKETRKEYTLNTEQMKGLADNDKITLVDVREPYEVYGGRVPAKRYVHIPLGFFYGAWQSSEEDFEKKFGAKKPKPDEEVVFMCRGGIRSTFAMQLAQDMGYSKAKNYPDGWNGWEKSLD